jgi:insulysin
VALVGASLLAVATIVGVVFAVSKPYEPNVVVQTDEVNVVAQADLSKIMVTKGPNDPYRSEVYTLKNGLEVLLTQVPEADRAAAALSVRVGTWSDPEDVLGLAHFCEHAVFLGSEAFPDESAYGELLSEHGGSYNAYTAIDSTNFFFSVQADALNETLARFAPFMISPLFKEDSLSREMLAVESEYTKSLLQDSWRFSQVRANVVNMSTILSFWLVDLL